MPFPGDRAAEEQRFVRYLIGSLPDEEIESLDELSIADDDVASRLSAAENDLVDAYVRGGLSGETLARFESHYLSTPAGREKVRFAKTLHAYQGWPATAKDQTTPRRWFVLPGFTPRWEFAAAALVAAAVLAYLVVDNVRLRSLASESRAERISLAEREQQLQRQLNDQRSATAARETELARAQESLAALEARTTPGQQGGPVAVVSFVLAPPTRGAGEIPTLAIPAGTAAITLRLALDADEFPRYRAALKDPATDRIVWRGDSLRSAAGSGETSLSISLGAGLLKPQTYTIEVTGVSAGGAPEMLTSYAFRVTAK